MGVKNLWDILDSCKKTLPLHHLQNKRVCIDLSCWIVQLYNACKTPSCIHEKLYLRNLFHRLRALIALNCSLIFVADGSIPAIKLSAYRKRLGLGNEVARNESNLQRASSLPRNKGSAFSIMIKEAKLLGLALGIPCLDGLEEAEAQCAMLNSESLCDGCFTSDSDIFLFGASTVYKDIYFGEGGYVVCYEMIDIERKLGFGRNSLITLALLLGSDYSQGVHGLGRKTACRIIKSVGDDIVLDQMVLEGLEFVKRAKGTTKQGPIPKSTRSTDSRLDHGEDMIVTQARKQDPVSTNQFLQVINAYLKPKCHSPDSTVVQRAFIQHFMQRTQLQQLCAEFFGWSPEKTDEYILPKIVERDLRRFANLRSTSSALGICVPLDKMPVTCPLSAIVKQRKLQGREYFEVSWEGVDGLQTSVVPADLVKSACPEKIVEFIERRDEKKKQNKKTRPKKAVSRADVHEIDLNLQNLVLGMESQSENPSDAATCFHLVGPTPSRQDTEVIDLLTPSPCIRHCRVAKCVEPIDVIELSESESDISPEHQRKARELRLFLAGIEEDVS